MTLDSLRKVIGGGDVPIIDEVSEADLRVVLAGLGAETRRWCTTHDAESIENHGGTSDECWRVVWSEPDVPEGLPLEGYDLCRIVEAVRWIPGEPE